MKKILITAILILSCSAFANFDMAATVNNHLVEFEVNEIFSNLNITLGRLDQNSSNIRNAYLQINYYDKNSVIVKNDKIQLTYDEILNCFVTNDQSCTLNTKSLSQVFKAISCKLDIKLMSYTEKLLASRDDLLWGNCGEIPTPLDPLRRVDLYLKEDSLIVDSMEMPDVPFSLEPIKKLSIKVSNQGKRDLLDRVNMVALGEDRTGNLIWASSTIIDTIRIDEDRVFNFTTPIQQKQWHRLCRVRFIVDSKYKISEENKLNNEQVVNLGLCEDSPTYQDGGRIDFRPWIEKEDGKLVLYFFNIGNIDFNKEERVKFTFTATDKNRGAVQFTRDIQGELFSYGDYQTFEIDQNFVAGKCHFKVQINPFYRVNESDFLNNVFELDICN